MTHVVNGGAVLAQYLTRLATEYTYERAKPFTGSAFGDFVRHDIAVEAKKKLVLWPFDLKVKSSVGKVFGHRYRGLRFLIHLSPKLPQKVSTWSI